MAFTPPKKQKARVPRRERAFESRTQNRQPARQVSTKKIELPNAAAGADVARRAGDAANTSDCKRAADMTVRTLSAREVVVKATGGGLGGRRRAAAEMSHNSAVRRALAAILLAVFAFLATADTFACPDGCQCASSRAAAARCDASGVCVFCTAAAMISVPPPAVVHFTPADLVADAPFLASPRPPVAPPDHPPRLV